MIIYREFPRKSDSEKFLKIGLHLPKLLSKVKFIVLF